MSMEPHKSVIVAFGGGKGGVGKTLLASAVARRLVEQGKSVAVIDADFARPSLLASATGKESGISMSDFLTGLSYPSTADGKENKSYLRIISGQDLFPDVANNGWRAEKFNRVMRKFQENYVILDLGPGTALFTLDCFLHSDIGVFVTTPDPFAERDCFHFAQSCLMHGLRSYSQKNPEVNKLLRFLEKRNENERLPLKQFLQRFNNGIHLVSSILDEIKSYLKTGIVVNMTKDSSDDRDGHIIRTVFQDFLGLDVELWGQIRFDKELRNKIRTKSELPLQFTADFECYTEKLFSILNLYEFSGVREQRNGKNGKAQKLQTPARGYTVDVICSTKCLLWEECQHRRGGYPCRIKAIGHLKSLEGERYLKDQQDIIIVP